MLPESGAINNFMMSFEQRLSIWFESKLYFKIRSIVSLTSSLRLIHFLGGVMSGDFAWSLVYSA